MKVYIVQECVPYEGCSTYKAFLSREKAQTMVDEENRKFSAHRKKVEAWRQAESEFYRSQDKSTLEMFTSELVELSNQFNAKNPFPVPEEDYINSCELLSVGELEVEE